MTTTTDNYGLHTHDLRIQEIIARINELKALCIAGCQGDQTFEDYWVQRQEWLEEMRILEERWDALEAELTRMDADPVEYRELPEDYVPATWTKTKNAKQIQLRAIWAALKVGQI